jgi:hypothetical protein
LHPIRFIAAALALSSLAHAGEHPTLLIRKSDVPRIRHACGVGAPPANSAGMRFGKRGSDFQVLRNLVAAMLSAESAASAPTDDGPQATWLPGELLAIAFLHVVEPEDPQDARRIAAVSAALQSTGVAGDELFECVIALDWCWSSIAEQVRRDFMTSVRSSLRPLSPGDSPLEFVTFRDRLAGLAATAAFDPDDALGESWDETRVAILGAARPWIELSLKNFLAWRGGIPTSPENGKLEECGVALAIELAATLGGDAWATHGATAGRWLEHYLLVGGEAGRNVDFVRDAPGDGALTPSPRFEGLLPLTAHLIAARTRSPVAAALADRVDRDIRVPGEALRGVWRWIPIVFDCDDVPQVDAARLPTARNLDGAIVLRGDGPRPVTVWIDAAQPILNARQHFDAGGFLIRRGSDLAVTAADELAQFATAKRGGQMRLGRSDELFDFEQYNAATIAHNAMLFSEANRVTRWYGKIYQPLGGQIPREGTCRDLRRSLDEQGRTTGRLLAFATQSRSAYAALDLTAAYDSRAVSAYTREFVWLLGRVLVVIDRAKVPHGRVTPTFVLNLPARPTVDGGPLLDAARTLGSDDNAGVWQFDRVSAVRVTNRDDALWIVPAWPSERRVALSGGPAEPLSARTLRGEPLPYIGGEADGFERRISANSARSAPNAWFRIGQLPPEAERVARSPLWGRLEIESRRSGVDHVFVTVLVCDDAAAPTMPLAQVETRDGLLLRLAHGADQAEILLPPAAGKEGGELRIGDAVWRLPAQVVADPPLETRSQR